MLERIFPFSRAPAVSPDEPARSSPASLPMFQTWHSSTSLIGAAVRSDPRDKQRADTIRNQLVNQSLIRN